MDRQRLCVSIKIVINLIRYRLLQSYTRRGWDGAAVVSRMQYSVARDGVVTLHSCLSRGCRFSAPVCRNRWSLVCRSSRTHWSGKRLHVFLCWQQLVAVSVVFKLFGKGGGIYSASIELDDEFVAGWLGKHEKRRLSLSVVMEMSWHKSGREYELPQDFYFDKC